MSIQDEQILNLVDDPLTLNKGFKLLMSVYQERLYHHIRSILDNHNDTDDVLQNTFIKVFKYLPKFEGRSKLYTWMFRIATNEAMSFLKKNKKVNSLIADVQIQPDIKYGSRGGEISSDYVKLVLQKAILQLPLKQKEVFSLRYFEEMTYKEMSSVLETSEGALKASYHHAVKKIEIFIKNVQVY